MTAKWRFRPTASSSDAAIRPRIGPFMLWKQYYILRARQNRRQFPDDSFNCILLNENIWTPMTIWLKFIPNGPINNIPALVQIMTLRQPGEKPFSEPVMAWFVDAYMLPSAQWIQSKDKCFTLSWLPPLVIAIDKYPYRCQPTGSNLNYSKSYQ